MLPRRSILVSLGAITLTGPAWANVRDSIFELTNAVRAGQGISTLELEPNLTQAAQGHAETMARLDELSHTAGGTNLASRVLATGYRFRRLAENIAYRSGPDDAMAARIMEQWMGSPGHQANILDTRLRQIGVGVSRSGARTYAVQVFGTRA
ncbi:MAG: CAP domain-containing protein [Pseudomonadota bacterium]